MSEPLWDDDYIEYVANDIAAADDAVGVATAAADMLRQQRSAASRRIAELEAQLAERGEWQPVGEDVKIESPIPGDNRYMIVSAINEDGDHGLTISDVENRRGMIMPLPDGYALCRRTRRDA